MMSSTATVLTVIAALAASVVGVVLDVATAWLPAASVIMTLTLTFWATPSTTRSLMATSLTVYVKSLATVP